MENIDKKNKCLYYNINFAPEDKTKYCSKGDEAMDYISADADTADRRKAVLNLCQGAIQMSNDDFKIFISKLKTSEEPVVQKLCDYLKYKREA